jgi:serpin B
MKQARTTPVLVLVLILTGLATNAHAASAETGPEPEKAACGMNAFAIDLYRRLAEKEQADNVCLSPASISIALSMTSAGARGSTADEMRQALRLELDDAELHPAMGRLIASLVAETGGSQLSIANALWVQQGFGLLDPFTALTRDHYHARAANLNIRDATEEARRTINSWTEEQTNDRIRELLKPGVLDPLTRLVLTNAVYFKGTWKTQFDEDETRQKPFHLAAGDAVPAKMMHLRDEIFRYLGDGKLQLLELPYAGEQTSMIVLLPEEGKKLGDLEGELSAEKLDDWLGRMRKTELDLVALPRFSLTRHYRVAETLREMGMRQAFDAESADFSGITADDELFISDVIHQSFVEVNEEGTEAAAATAVAMTLASAGPTTVFRANRPFLFLIRDRESGTILFMRVCQS